MANGLYDGWDAGQSAYDHAEPAAAEPGTADPGGGGAPPEVLRGQGEGGA
jgi:hypothetical protein